MRYDFDKILDRRNTGSLKWDFCERVLKETDVIPMWVADMDFPAPQSVVDAIKKRAEHPAYGYPMIPRSYWTAIIDWMRTRTGWEVKREWLTKSPGVVPALSLCVQAFTRPGDKIVIQSPVYRPFYTAVENNGRRIVRNPLRFEKGRFLMDFEDLEKKIDPRTRMVIFCSPHNPVGRVWTREELERFGEICVEKDLLILSDEIHADLVFPGHKHVAVASLSEKIAAQTITCMAPSKTFNVAGLSTSVVIATNPKLLRLFTSQAQNAGLTEGNIFGIVALEAAYRDGAEWLDQLLVYLDGNMAFAEEFFKQRVPRIRFVRPEGTFLALLDCRDLEMTQKELNEFFLKKAKVYFEDGAIFGEELVGFERANFACSRAVLAQVLENIEKAVSSLPPG